VGVTVGGAEAYADANGLDKKGRSLRSQGIARESIWQMVDLKLKHFSSAATAGRMRKVRHLKNGVIATRLAASVQPVTEAEYEAVGELARAK